MLFGSGGTIPCAALQALAAKHSVVAVVRPEGPSWRSRIGALAASLGLRAADPFLVAARNHNIPVIKAQNGNDLNVASQLQKLSPDLICIASFPWLLHESIFSLSPLGAINVHPSLLPRHRGPNPFFWTYFHDDRTAGVTAHVVTRKADSGDLLAQQSFPLLRGMPLGKLHDEVSRRGSELLTEVADALERGGASRTPQDPAAATKAPRIRPGTPMVDFASWPAERVWHFLAGLYPHFREPLAGAPYRAVTGFEICQHKRGPGCVEAVSGGWRLYCVDGYIKLSASRWTQ